jgi:hypothetical protein
MNIIEFIPFFIMIPFYYGTFQLLGNNPIVMTYNHESLIIEVPTQSKTNAGGIHWIVG